MREIKRIRRKKKVRIENLSVSPISETLIADIASNLAKQITKKDFEKKYTPIKNVLLFAGAGVFLAASLAIPNLPLVLKPFMKDKDEYEVWKRFNIPYLKRTLRRLEKQKLVEISEGVNTQTVKITESGKRRILKYAIDELTIEKPKFWDGKWRLISYDIPGNLRIFRDAFREHLLVWGFFPLHESVLMHAYPCQKQVEFLREYLGVGEYVRIFSVSNIENDKPFRDFFGV